MINGDSDASGSAAIRSFTFPDGRRLTVRRLRETDVDALDLHYHRLPPDDLRYRFFGVFYPRRSFLEARVGLADRGGLALVAVMKGADERLVAEAEYTLLPDGDGELGISVTPGWRGWLGPYLLDALLDVAAQQGVPNLQADILVDNRRMLALVRRRGYAVLGHEDFSSIRVAISTRAGMPSWPGQRESPRVLVETPGGRWHAKDVARRAGMQVVVCPGPGGDRVSTCPVIRGQTCPLAAGADAIICNLVADERTNAIVGSHRGLHRPVPVLREPAVGSPASEDLLSSGVLVIPPGTNDDRLVEILRTLMKPDSET